MKHKLYTRLLSLALAVGLVIGMLPSAAAVDTVGDGAGQSVTRSLPSGSNDVSLTRYLNYWNRTDSLSSHNAGLFIVDENGQEICSNLTYSKDCGSNEIEFEDILSGLLQKANKSLNDYTVVEFYLMRYGQKYDFSTDLSKTWYIWQNGRSYSLGMRVLSDKFGTYQFVQNNDQYYVVLRKNEPLGEVETVDSASKGVNISLFNYSESQINSATNKEYSDYQDWHTKEAPTFRFNGGGDPFGYGWNTWVGGAGVYQGIVNDALTTLNNGTKVPSFKADVTGQTNLSYLFTQNYYATAYTGLNHLFVKSTYDSTGYYEYDAGNNFATIADNLSDKNFKVYNQPYKPGDTAAATPKFLPFNDLNNNANTLTPQDPDYLFGMMVDFEFVQPQSGKITNNGTTNDMVFEFTGDDDVWVFIDDVLVLDMGGIHDAMTGSINFATGAVKVNKVKPNNTEQTKTLYNIMLAAKGSDWVNENMVQNESGNWVFKDYTNHTFNYYYLERGAGGSNCRIRFNLQTVPKGSLSVGKTAVGESKDIAYKFQLKNSSGQNVANQQYTVGTSQTGTTDSNGYFTLKSGQLATFTGLTDGDYTVTELNGDNDSYSLSDYTTTVTTTDGDGTSSGQIATSGTVTVDPATAATVGFTNTKAEKGEGNLEITKTFTDGNGNAMAIPEDLASIKLTILETYNPGGGVQSEQYTHTVTLTKQVNGSFSGTLEGVRYYTDFTITKEELLDADGNPIANAGDWTMGDFVLDRYAEANVTAERVEEKPTTVYTLSNSAYVLVKDGGKWYLIMNHVPEAADERAEFKEMVIYDILEAAASAGGGGLPAAQNVELLTLEEAAQEYKATLTLGEAGNATLNFGDKSVWSFFYAGVFEMTNVTMEATLDNVLNKDAKTQVSVNKVWSDSQTVDHNGDSVTVNLLKNGTATGQKVILTSPNWTGSFTNLDKYNTDGSLIQYTVTEGAVSGYTASISGSMTAGFTITNTREVGSLTITKTVNGLDDAALNELKGEISFEVKDSTGKVIQTISKTSENWADAWSGSNFTYTINNLPTGSYTVTEAGYNDLENYSWVASSSTVIPKTTTVTTNGGKVEFTNYYTGKDGTLIINKKVTEFANNGKPVFDFKLTAQDGTVYYYHVDMTGTVVNTAKAATPDGGVTLPVGDYTIEELSNQNYTLKSVEGATANNDATYKVTITPNGTTIVTFTNDPKNTNIPTDGSATENKVLEIKDGVIAWKQEPVQYGNDPNHDNINPDDEPAE